VVRTIRTAPLLVAAWAVNSAGRLVKGWATALLFSGHGAGAVKWIGVEIMASSFEPLSPDEAAIIAARPRMGARNQLVVSTLPHAWIDWCPWENIPPRSGFWLRVKYEDDITGAITFRDTTIAHLWLRVDSSRYLRLRADWTPEGELSAGIEMHGLDPAPLDQVEAILDAWHTCLKPGRGRRFVATPTYIAQLHEAFVRLWRPEHTPTHQETLAETGIGIGVDGSEDRIKADPNETWSTLQKRWDDELRDSESINRN